MEVQLGRVSTGLPIPPVDNVAGAELESVTCKGLNCAAVGFFANTLTTETPLAYTSNDGGKTWIRSQIPIPVPAGSTTNGFLGVSGT